MNTTIYATEKRSEHGKTVWAEVDFDRHSGCYTVLCFYRTARHYRQQPTRPFANRAQAMRYADVWVANCNL